MLLFHWVYTECISFSILTMSRATFSLLSQSSFNVNFKYSFVLTHSCQSSCIIFPLLLYFPVSRDVTVASYLGKFVISQNKEFVEKRKQTPDAIIVFEICNSQDFYCKVIIDLLSLLLLLIIHSSTAMRQASLAFFCIKVSCCFLCCRSHFFIPVLIWYLFWFIF